MPRHTKRMLENLRQVSLPRAQRQNTSQSIESAASQSLIRRSNQLRYAPRTEKKSICRNCHQPSDIAYIKLKKNYHYFLFGRIRL